MDTTTDQLSVPDAEGLLALVPHALGFRPARSLVLLIMDGKRLLATLRVDLPPSGEDAAADLRAAELAAFVGDLEQATGVFPVVYDEAAPNAAGPPYAPFVQSLALHLRGGRFDVSDAWWVGDGVWRSYFCQDPRCCPTQGRPLTDVELSDTNLRMLLSGSSPVAELWDGSPDNPWPDHLAVRAAVERFADGPDAASPVACIDAWSRLCREGPDGSIARLRADPLAAAVLLAGLRLKGVRDAVPAAAALSAELARDAVVDMAAGRRSGAVDAMAELMVGQYGGTPDWKAVDRLYAVGRSLVAVAEGEDRCALLCVLAWVEWARGQGSAAGRLIDACRDEDRDYRLAELLDGMLGRGALPAWARRSERAWKRQPETTGRSPMPRRD